MDPTECLRLLLRELAAVEEHKQAGESEQALRHRLQAEEHLDNLQVWLAGGGFTPHVRTVRDVEGIDEARDVLSLRTFVVGRS